MALSSSFIIIIIALPSNFVRVKFAGSPRTVKQLYFFFSMKIMNEFYISLIPILNLMRALSF